MTRSNTMGPPPTDLKARTGEETPPGIRFMASFMSAADLVVTCFTCVDMVMGTLSAAAPVSARAARSDCIVACERRVRKCCAARALWCRRRLACGVRNACAACISRAERVEWRQSNLPSSLTRFRLRSAATLEQRSVWVLSSA